MSPVQRICWDLTQAKPGETRDMIKPIVQALATYDMQTFAKNNNALFVHGILINFNVLPEIALHFPANVPNKERNKCALCNKSEEPLGDSGPMLKTP